MLRSASFEGAASSFDSNFEFLDDERDQPSKQGGSSRQSFAARDQNPIQAFSTSMPVTASEDRNHEVEVGGCGTPKSGKCSTDFTQFKINNDCFKQTVGANPKVKESKNERKKHRRNNGRVISCNRGDSDLTVFSESNSAFSPRSNGKDESEELVGFPLIGPAVTNGEDETQEKNLKRKIENPCYKKNRRGKLTLTCLFDSFGGIGISSRKIKPVRIHHVRLTSGMNCGSPKRYCSAAGEQ